MSAQFEDLNIAYRNTLQSRHMQKWQMNMSSIKCQPSRVCNYYKLDVLATWMLFPSHVLRCIAQPCFFLSSQGEIITKCIIEKTEINKKFIHAQLDSRDEVKLGLEKATSSLLMVPSVPWI